MDNESYSQAEWLADELGGKPSGDGWWLARCPAHDDRKASFSIGTPGGKLWVGCFVCDDEKLRAALVARGLWPVPSSPVAAPTAPRPAQRAPRAQKTAAERTARALAIWDAAAPIDPDDQDCPALMYLRSRGIASAAGSPSLRYGRCKHKDGGMYQSLICRIDDAQGLLQAVHVIHLRHDGTKAPVNGVKISRGPISGGAFRFGIVSDGLVIAEGVESAISAGILLNMPAWATLGASNLKAGIKLPASVKTVVVAADNDAPGIDAAEQAYHHFAAQGRIVRMRVPNRDGEDFNDILMRRIAKGAV